MTKSSDPIPLLDLRAQYHEIEAEIRIALDRVIDSQRFILGPEVEALEAEIAAFCGVRHAIGVSSGTDALLVALMALDVGPGDEVVTSAYSFFASAGVVARLGARPVFVDIHPQTLNIDPVGVAAALTGRTRAVVPVHLFGQCADMDPILEIAGRRGVAVVEDAAQSLGAGHRGRRAGTMGEFGCFSFFPSKNLGAFGDGGMVVTDDDGLAQRVRALRVHGAAPKYHHALIGGNFRLDALQAAVLRVKLPHLGRWAVRRRANAEFYSDAFADSGLVSRGAVVTPTVRDDDHVFNQYILRCADRDGLRSHLSESGIGTEIYYPIPLHLQQCFQYLEVGEGSLPISEKAARETLALPVFPELTEEQLARVVTTIVEYYDRS